jgi:outer membrane immunogenic protein
MPCLRTLILAGSLAMPTHVAADDWSGSYAGAQINRFNFNLLSGAAMSLDGVKGAYGIHVGHAFDLGTLVVAAELEYDRTDADLGSMGKIDNTMRLRALFGQDMNRFMPYLTVGYGWGDVSGGTQDSADGPLAGLGLAYRLSHKISVSVDYMHQELSGGSGFDGDTDTLGLRVDYRF